MNFYDWWNNEGRGMQHKAFDSNHANPSYFEVANAAWNAALASVGQPLNKAVQDRCADCGKKAQIIEIASGTHYCRKCYAD